MEKANYNQMEKAKRDLFDILNEHDTSESGEAFHLLYDPTTKLIEPFMAIYGIEGYKIKSYENKTFEDGKTFLVVRFQFFLDNHHQDYGEPNPTFELFLKPSFDIHKMAPSATFDIMWCSSIFYPYQEKQ